MISEYELRMMAHDTHVRARASDDGLTKRRLFRLADDYLRQADELLGQRIIRAAYRKAERKVRYSLRP
jgi:phosphatidylserine/phosphatidylglycerophosphate/cardiolipin synthase-like enzyme